MFKKDQEFGTKRSVEMDTCNM